MNNPKLFLNSSVLFSAVASVSGGSSKLFQLDDINLVTSDYVLTEVANNVNKKLFPIYLKRLSLLRLKLGIVNTQISSNFTKDATKIIIQKDVLVLAAARECGSDYLVTFDRKDFMNPAVRKYFKPGEIITPGEFINAHYKGKK